MKKLAKISALIVAGLMLFSFTKMASDGSFEGLIIQTVSVDGSTNPQAAQMMQSMSIKTYIKGSMTRTETNFGMGQSITITDKNKPDGTITLLQMMGNKYEIKADPAKAKKESGDAPTIKYLDGTKTIAGYPCKEAQMTMKDKRSGDSYTSDIYYTDQLPFNNDNSSAKFKGLKGFPMSFTVQQNGMTITFATQSINKQSVPDSLFTVPAGYQVVTQEQLMSQMGGGAH